MYVLTYLCTYVSSAFTDAAQVDKHTASYIRTLYRNGVCVCACACVRVCMHLCCAAIVLIASEQLMGLPSTATCDRLSRGEGHNIRGRSKRGRGRRGRGRRRGIIEQQVVCDWTYIHVRTYVHTLNTTRHNP